MTNMQLLEAIGLLDEQTVLDAEQPVAKVLPSPRARLMRQISAVAACTLLLFGGAVLSQMGGLNTKSEEPAAPADGSPTYAVAGATTAEEPEFTAAPAGDGAANTPTAATTAGAHHSTTTAATYATTTAATTSRPPSTTTTGGGYHTTKPGEDPGMTTGIATTSATPGENVPSWSIYSQDLNGISDTQDSEQALQAIGLQQLAVLDREGDATFAVRDGRLYFKQTADESRFVLTALGGDYMESAVDSGYTVQYELEYTSASADAFAALITDMKQDGKSLRRFAVRADGSTVYDTVYDGIRKPVYETASGKLSGVGTVLTGVRLTVRVQWHPDRGHTVFVKTADMIEFVEVGTAVGGTHTASDGFAVGLSLCGAVEGYLDNIRLWLGFADEPSSSDIRYVPYTKAP